MKVRDGSVREFDGKIPWCVVYLRQFGAAAVVSGCNEKEKVTMHGLSVKEEVLDGLYREVDPI